MLVQEQNLVPSISVENLIQQRDAALEAVERIRKAAHELLQIGNAAGISLPSVEFNGYGLHRHLYDGDIRADIDARFWGDLINKTGLRTFMDAKRRSEWDRKIHNHQGQRKQSDIPEFTRENIEATCGKLHAQRGEMVVDGVVQVFQGLSWDYKTNNPVQFDRKIITFIGDWRYSSSDKLDDLNRVLHIFEGKPEPDYRDGLQAKYRESQTGFGRNRATIENEYLHITVYKNGNAHVTFKDLDHVKQLNRMVAQRFPGCLPAGRKAA